MKNLKEALTLILKAVETGMKAYQDQKINVGEWIAIGMKIIAWVWIFRNLKNILADIVNATQEEFTQMHTELCEGFDIPQDQIEEKIEQSLSLVLLIISMIWGKKEVELALKTKNGIQAGSNMA
jgi:hypothetical protein